VGAAHYPTIPQMGTPVSAVKIVDNKGRLTLGTEFAGQVVEIEQHGRDEVVVKMRRLIPASEAWLWENDEAISLVRTGLNQAARGELSSGPDLDGAFKFADSIPDETE
jgi:hypothetical protein